ncbi:MAG: Uncharacterized UPF0118 membrane protein, partial [uncultured Nocardioides sp.]
AGGHHARARRGGRLRLGHRAGDLRPGLQHHPERPRLARPAAAEPPRAAARRRVRRHRQGPREDRAGRPRLQPRRRGAGHRSAGPLDALQRLHRRGADALLPRRPRRHQERPAAARPRLEARAGQHADRPGDQGCRRLRVGRLHRRPLRRPLQPGVPPRGGSRRVRRRARVRGGPPRRHPDDRRHHRRGRRDGHRLRHRPDGRHRLRDLLPRLPAAGELRHLSPGDVALGRHPRLGDGHRGPGGCRAARCRRRPARHPHRRGGADAHPGAARQPPGRPL